MLMIVAVTVMVALAAACGGGSTELEEKVPGFTPAPPATAATAFTEDDIRLLTQQQLISGKDFPPGAPWVSCDSASFKPDTDMWVVTCNLYADQAATQYVLTRSYTVSDKDGKLVAGDLYSTPP